MKLTRWALPAVMVGSFSIATTSMANDRMGWRSDRAADSELSRSDRPSERYPSVVGDDESLAPGVPGITENNTSDMSRRQVRAAQEALREEGYDPGRHDGVMDNNTRAAIRDFQKDHQLVITGTVDDRTADIFLVSAPIVPDG
jgi:hypothetical protein